MPTLLVARSHATYYYLIAGKDGLFLQSSQLSLAFRVLHFSWTDF
jgi:hypothetical protein